MRSTDAGRMILGVLALFGVALAAPRAGAYEEEETEGVFMRSCEMPAWSPDGTRIAYSADAAMSMEEDVNYEIYVIQLQTGAIARLTTDPSRDTDPAWSPDGSRIAFSSDRSGQSEVWIMNADGSTQMQLTRQHFEDDKTGRGNSGPAWSPDGTIIAFSSDRAGKSDIVIMAPDGTELRYFVAFPTTSEGDSTWSPDGQRIAFSGEGGVWVRNLDGSALTQLTVEPQGTFDGEARWSPTGTKIALRRADLANHGANIYVMNDDGSDLHPLFANPPSGRVDDPAWSPNGAKIAFVAGNPNGKGEEIFYANADGTGITQVTHLNDQ